MTTMWKIGLLILFCAGHFALGIHLHKRDADFNDKVGLNDQCLKDEDCITDNAKCMDDVCACGIDFDEYKEECVEKATVGTECSDNERCKSLDHSICMDAKCQCEGGFVATGNKSLCLKLASAAGDECLIFEQCRNINRSICENSKCVIPPVSLGEKCSATEICNVTQNLECKDEICQCLENYVESEKNCLKKADKVNDTCTVEGQCSHINANCVSNVCTAIPELPVPPPVNLENSCSETVSCTQNNTECKEGFCRCLEGYIRSESTKNCLKNVEQVGVQCQEDSRCLSLNTTCVNSTCGTPEKVPEKQNIVGAFARVNIGDRCNDDNDCQRINNSVCKEKVCECTTDYVAAVESTSCLRIARKLGDACEIDKQCKNFKGTFCNGNKCVQKAKEAKSLRGNSATTIRRISELTTGILFVGIALLF